MTGPELNELLLTVLSGTTRQGRRDWKKMLGPAHVYPMSTHPYCNWEFQPSGPADDVAAALKAAEIAQAAHPNIR
jgi:hypothetical protein